MRVTPSTQAPTGATRPSREIPTARGILSAGRQAPPGDALIDLRRATRTARQSANRSSDG